MSPEKVEGKKLVFEVKMLAILLPNFENLIELDRISENLEGILRIKCKKNDDFKELLILRAKKKETTKKFEQNVENC
jgi:hypothetical protein